jgi:hypothetical protein
LDTAAVARLATTLAELAERDMPIGKDDYFALRGRVLELVGDDSLLEPLFSTDVQTSASSGAVWEAPKILGVVSAYLRSLAVTGGPTAGRLMAATDLMEQAQRLFEDEDVTVIAPIVVAGAALEEVLRDLIETSELDVAGQPGLTTYAQSLRSGDVITVDDQKEVLSLASVRNDAAHGRTGVLSRERAGLFLDRVNLFLRQLQDRGASQEHEEAPDGAGAS